MTTDIIHEPHMRFVRMGHDGTVTGLCNPITRSWARLDPPFEADPAQGMADVGELEYKFGQFCEAAWTLETRRDPHVVNPYRVMDGTEPVDVMAAMAEQLAWEHGPYTAQAAVAKASDDYWDAQGFPRPA
jgi:hypothetical protein